MKKFFLSILLQTLINILLTLVIIFYVEKYSNNNLNNMDMEKVRTCMPWDAC